MTPVEVWEIVDFWAGVPWPVTRAEAHLLAIDRFGWEVEVENGREYLVNSVAGLTPPDVSTVDAETLMSLDFWIADMIREESAQSRALLGDLFTLTVREGVSRHGRPSLERVRSGTDATWSLAGNCQVTVSLATKSTRVEFHTPQLVEFDLKEDR